jgi:NAD(P)-dependent dehydrogenase (short-subunit alcohol dehydrogenase family)
MSSNAQPNPVPKALDFFRLDGRVALITGGCGLLGRQHAAAIASAGGIPVLLDIARANPAQVAAEIGFPCHGVVADITDLEALVALKDQLLRDLGRIDILINNAANNPKMESSDSQNFSRVEFFPMEMWHADIAVGLTGAFLCSRVFGGEMAARGGGVIVNVSSDLGLISPDQRLYSVPGLPPEAQPVKPVTYSVVKTGLIGLTRYLATYWAEAGVRVNAISPGGVLTNQPEDFVARLSQLIPLGRMARADEYQAAILFLCSDASSYMTGSNLVIEGGRTAW